MGNDVVSSILVGVWANGLCVWGQASMSGLDVIIPMIFQGLKS